MKNFLIKFIILFVIIWFIGIWFLITNRNTNSDSFDSNDHFYELNQEDTKNLIDRIREAETYLSKIELKNKKNELIIQNLRKQANKFLKSKPEGINLKLENLDLDDFELSASFEETRRKIFNDIKDLSNFVNSEIDQVENQQGVEKLKSKVKFLKQNFQNRINFLTAELYNLSITDKIGEWRKKLSTNLENEIQKEFYNLQNPSDCENSKKVICDINKSCGFGCQMHHLMYCFITSYFMKRTLIIESTGWRYNSQGYEAYFKPVSETCKSANEPGIQWDGSTSSEAKILKIPVIDEIQNKPDFFPLSIPKKYADMMTKFHGDPFVWWAGQILSYLMRFNSKFEEIIQTNRQNLKFKTPCVGVHVRRTDKVGTEAAYHSLEEYMKHVENYFDTYDLKYSKKLKRTVYLASDEISVLQEANRKYPEYNFIMDETNAKTASLNKRYSPESAQGVILDIYFLSQCDYLVCTLSSQVCRMAYELMQTRYPDASWRFKSLDDVYYYGGQTSHNVVAIYDHEPSNPDEIELKTGDLIGLAGNHWNGYSKGKNLRTKKEGLFPTYKVKDQVKFY